MQLDAEVDIEEQHICEWLLCCAVFVQFVCVSLKCIKRSNIRKGNRRKGDVHQYFYCRSPKSEQSRGFTSLCGSSRWMANMGHVPNGVSSEGIGSCGFAGLGWFLGTWKEAWLHVCVLQGRCPWLCSRDVCEIHGPGWCCCYLLGYLGMQLYCSLSQALLEPTWDWEKWLYWVVRNTLCMSLVSVDSW